MDYGIISRVEKAKVYAEERDQRIDFESFKVILNGENSSHVVNYDQGEWDCDCGYFTSTGFCAHTTAMERVLENMVKIAV